MAFPYNPKDANDCLDVGMYPAELTTVTEKVSKSGNNMLAIIWRVPYNGRDWFVRDFIVNPSTLFKMKQIARAWNMQYEFNEGTFDLTLHLNKLITLKLEVKNSVEYGDQNNVAAYAECSGLPTQEVGAAPNSDSDVPF